MCLRSSCKLSFFFENKIMIKQYPITLKSKGRGYHLITEEILSNIVLPDEHGMLHLFIQHTSAGLTINENADPSVRSDFETIMNRIVPEDQEGLIHTFEGPDDMPAHIKSSLVGASLQIPFRNGELCLGTWQGIYLCEFRNQPHQRRLIATIISN